MKKYFYILILLVLILILILIIGFIIIDQKMTEDEITIGLTGDVMLGRLVNQNLNVVDYKYPWGNMLLFLKQNDLNLINLETTFTTSNQKVPKTFNFKTDPEKIQVLKEANIDLVNIANNHILDFSEQGLLETIEVLDKAGIKHVGAGKNLEEAKEVVIIEKKGIKIGILGYTDNEPEWIAGKNNPGTNYVRIGDRKKLEEIKKEIKELKNKVNIIIFTIHWGPNMVQAPSKEFQDFAHSIIDAGADIFHGHSAHIFQGIEVYKKKLILYDTGDFIDDYAVDPELRNDQSFLSVIKADKKEIKEVKLIPTLISFFQVNKATGEDYTQTTERMQSLSKGYNTELLEDEREMILKAR